jgi:hypothetical protein
MRWSLWIALALGASTATSFAKAPTAPLATAASLGLFAYPKGKQSAAKQSKDESECYSWAQQSTGTDPIRVAMSAPPPSAPAPRSSAGRSAAMGAAGGAVLGKLTGGARRGAAIGAGAGALAGKSSDRQRAEAEAVAQAEQQDWQDQQMEGFRRAFRACLEGRNYSVE